MEALSPQELRRSFVNASRSQVAAMTLPPGLGALDWDTHDYLGWRDAKLPARAYLVAPLGSRVVGVLLRTPGVTSGRRSASLCELCRAAHRCDDVSLQVAPRAGAPGRDGNTVGTYICADLACSAYARGLRETDLTPAEPPGPERVARLQHRLAVFLGRVLGEHRQGVAG
ncbi:FBP domain-containing protein [Kineococcus sp. NUM-3379]